MMKNLDKEEDTCIEMSAPVTQLKLEEQDSIDIFRSKAHGLTDSQPSPFQFEPYTQSPGGILSEINSNMFEDLQTPSMKFNEIGDKCDIDENFVPEELSLSVRKASI